jgi:regulation of enolase protein 1 (concanavalin A-like superfamily)
MVTARFLLCLISTLAFTACQISPQKPEEQVIQTYTEATLVSQATMLPSNTPLPTDTPTREIPTLSPTTETPPPPIPSPTSTSFFQDDFDQALEPGWFWVREDPSRWSLSTRPGFLRLDLGANDCNNPPNNVALQPPAQGNYEMETMVDFTPQQNFQLAGLIVYQDDDNFLKLGRAYCDSASLCIGNGIYFDFKNSGYPDKSNFATPTNNPSLIFLQLRKTASSYVGYLSEDGENWTIVGEHVSEIHPVGIGLYAGQSCGGSLPADFDFLSIHQLP